MFAQRSRIRRAMRNTVLWIGLLLMIASFAWMQWISKPEPGTSTQGPARHEPFSVVVLDPGHGGQDSGAKVGNMLEKDLTLAIARRTGAQGARRILVLRMHAQDHYRNFWPSAAHFLQ